MERRDNRRSLVNLAGSAAIVLTCAVWTGVAAEARQEPPANARTSGYDLKMAKKAVAEAERTTPPVTGGVIQKGREGAVAHVHGDPHVNEKDGTRMTAPPELASCSSGAATACRAIEGGMTGGLWTWKEGNVTAMDDWETQAARRGGMTVKFGPPRAGAAPEARATGNHIPSAVIVQRVLTACDGGDASACAAFAASVQPGRTYTGGR